MTNLSVNLNKIALLRNSRGSDYPRVTDFATLAIDAGARGITVHPRPDQRHITVNDTRNLAELLHKNHKAIEYNIEGNPFAPASCEPDNNYPGLMDLLLECRPHQATLVPDSDDQLTSDHGFDLKRDGEAVAEIIQRLDQNNIRTSLFMDPDPEQIELAKSIGAHRIELYTGPFAEAFGKEGFEAVFEQYRAAADHARAIDLGVNAGHDLNLENLPRFLEIVGVLEVSIGHALTVDALMMGYKQCVAAYRQICEPGS